MKKLIVAICLLAMAVPAFAEQTMTDEEITAAVGRTLQRQVDYEQNYALQKEMARQSFVEQYNQPVDTPKPEPVDKPETKDTSTQDAIIDGIGTMLQLILQ